MTGPTERRITPTGYPTIKPKRADLSLITDHLLNSVADRCADIDRLGQPSLIPASVANLTPRTMPPAVQPLRTILAVVGGAGTVTKAPGSDR